MYEDGNLSAGIYKLERHTQDSATTSKTKFKSLQWSDLFNYMSPVSLCWIAID